MLASDLTLPFPSTLNPHAPDRHAAPATPPAPPPLVLWEDLARIQQIGVEAALVGIPLADRLKPFEDRFEMARQAREDHIALETSTFDMEARRLEAELETLAASRAALVRRCAEVPALLREIGRADAGNTARLQGVVRLVQAVEPAARQRRRNGEDTHRREQQLGEARHRRTLADQRAATAIESREQNVDHLHDVEEERRKELAQTATHIDDVRARSHQLQQRGLTRPVARFLTWASCFSLPGIGIVLAYLFASRLPDPGANPAWALRLQEYIGVMDALLTASSGLLFWLFVLRPAVEGEHVRRAAKIFYTTILVLPVLALITIAVLPAAANRVAIATLGVALIVATSGLGHGLYLIGIFSREDHLERRRARLRDALESTTKRPTAEDYLDDLPPAIAVRTHEARFDRARKALARWWTRLAWRWRRSRGDRPIEGSIDYADVPADLLDTLNAAREICAVSQTDLAALQEERAVADRTLESLERTIGPLREELARLARHRIATLEAHQAAMLELITGYQRTTTALEQAYHMSRFARRTR